MKKIMAFTLALMLAVTMGITLTGCGGSSGLGEEASGEGEAKAQASAPSIDLSQIDWTVEPGIVDGYRTVTFGYTNNTDYEIVDFDLEFRVKDEREEEGEKPK